ARVVMLSSPSSSRPVPTTSTASGGAATRSIFSRITVTAPVISSTVSPRTRSAINSPPICEGVASPDIMRSKPRAASSRVSEAPVAALAMSVLKSSVTVASLGRAAAHLAPRTPVAVGVPGSGQVEEILQNDVAMLGRDAFRMELHAVHRQGLVREPHDQSVIGFGHGRQLVRHGGAIDDQRMIARGLERAVDAAEHAAALMLDRRQLAMHRDRRPHHLAAEDLPDRLVAEADPE